MNVLLAKQWEGQDPTGWWMSEKLDGVRAVWNGAGSLLSRNGNVFPAPDWFVDRLPLGVKLDGELWLGRGNFQKAVSVVRCGSSDKGWKDLSYCVFDAPSLTSAFEVRQAYLSGLNIQVAQQTRCTGLDQMTGLLESVLALGAEGLMLRKAGSLYEACRSDTLLKVKRFFDEEAVIIGYQEGLGRNKGRLGALICKDKTGVKFKVGTGLSDAQRDKPPKLGAKITFRFQERTRDGVPRFPSFVAVRDYE